MIFGTFAAQSLADLSEAELDAFEALLEAPDQEIYAWLSRQGARAAGTFDNAVFAQMKALCSRKNPTWNV